MAFIEKQQTFFSLLLFRGEEPLFLPRALCAAGVWFCCLNFALTRCVCSSVCSQNCHELEKMDLEECVQVGAAALRSHCCFLTYCTMAAVQKGGEKAAGCVQMELPFESWAKRWYRIWMRKRCLCS